MSDRPLFEGMDEQERLYAPESVPGMRMPAHEVDAGGATDTSRSMEPPSAAPVASVGTSTQAPSAPPNLGPEDGIGAPGDPDTAGRYPIGDVVHDDDARVV